MRRRHYRIVIDDPAEWPSRWPRGLKEVKQFRRERNDAFHFHWMLRRSMKLPAPVRGRPTRT